MNIKETLNHCSQLLKVNCISNSRLDAELILCHVLKMQRPELMVYDHNELTEEQREKLDCLVAKRSQGEPLAYLLGEKYFYKHCFKVCPGVLIPRPETEFIVEMAVHYLDKAKPLKVYDFGCGSGCIGLSILSEFSQASCVGFDNSKIAVQISNKNAQEVSYENRYIAKHLNLGQQPKQIDELVDLVVANPPYIAPEDERVEPLVHQHEPHEALYSSEKGFYHINTWLKWACENLKTGGFYIFEIGLSQSRQVEEMLAQHHCFELKEIVKDYAGIERIVVCQKREMNG